MNKLERLKETIVDQGFTFSENEDGSLIVKSAKYAKSLEDISRPYYIFDGKLIKAEAESQLIDQFTTKERANQVLALIQLLAFRDDIWSKGGYGTKVGVGLSNNKLVPMEEAVSIFRFKDKKTVKYFIETHKELLQCYVGIFKNN